MKRHHPPTEENSENKKRCTFKERKVSSLSKREDIRESPSNDFVSATAIGPLIADDAICSWFKMYAHSFVEKNPEYQNAFNRCVTMRDGDGFTPYIMKRGVEFENVVMNRILNDYPDFVCDIHAKHEDGYNEEKIQATLDAINDGVPLIFSGVLRDEESETYGVPDILAKCSIVKQLIKKPSSELRKVLKKIPDDRYVVIDIKYTTLGLRADGLHILNEGMNPRYKAQTYIYNRALSKIQGYDPKTTFILAYRYSYVSCGEKTVLNALDCLGVIDFSGKDKSISQAADTAARSLRRMRKVGLEFNPLKPYSKRNDDEKLLYPNMNNHYDFPWRPLKDAISENIGEMTKLWRCSVQHRNRALQNGVKSIYDKACTSQALGMGGEVVPEMVNTIISALQNPTKKSVHIYGDLPEDIVSKYAIELYVDFETLSNAVSSSPLTDECLNSDVTPNAFLYLISARYVIVDRDQRSGNETETRNIVSFVAEDLTDESELKMCCDFLDFVKTLKKTYGFSGPVPMYHWGNAEKYIWDKIMEKHNLSLRYDLQESWVDVHKIFRTLPITIRGATDFALKSIVKAMTEENLFHLNIEYKTECDNGCDSMILAMRAYAEHELQSIATERVEDNPLMQKVIEYNTTDCLAIEEIVRVLRED